MVFGTPDENNSFGITETIPGIKIWVAGKRAGINAIETSFLTHEMGHALGLYHTFHGTFNEGNYYSCAGGPYTDPNQSCEPVLRTNTTLLLNSGDYVADTDADPFFWQALDPNDCNSINFVCNPYLCNDISDCPPILRDMYIVPGTNKGSPYTPPVNNVMSYQNYESCVNGFTSGQEERMLTVIDNSSILQATLTTPGVNNCCCPEDAIVLNNMTISAAICQGLLPANPNSNICIMGNLELDSSFNFDNYNMYMGSGASINILPSITVSFNNCIIEGCSTMWKGITSEGFSRLYMRDVTLKDAYNGIEGLPTSDIYLSGVNLFKDNYIGIKGISVSHLSVRETTFDFDEFKPGYTGMPPIGERAWAGIDISRSQIYYNGRSAGMVSNSCNFQNLANGIISESTDLYITFPTFKDIISSQPGFIFPIDGYGIKATGLANTIYLSGYGKNAPLKTFENVTIGMSLGGMAINQIKNCTMVDVEYGIYAIGSKPYGTRSKITNNQIESNNAGIVLIGNPQTPITIDKNIFNSYASTSGLFLPRFRSGTYISPYIYWPQTQAITPTTVENNEYHVYSAEYGVRVLEGENVFVQGHNDQYFFKLYDSENNVAGISIEGVRGVGAGGGSSNYIRYNNVVGTENSNASGIESVNSNGITMECNFTDSTYNGYKYAGQHNGIFYRTNNTKEHENGLYLDRFAEIGQQFNAGNTFGLYCDPGGIGGCGFFEALCQSDNPDQSLFIIPAMLPVNDPLKPFPVDPPIGEWFLEDPTIQITTTCEIPDNPPPPPPPVDCEFTEHDYWIIADTMYYSDYSKERRFINQQLLYDKIKNDTCFDIMPSGIENFYLGIKDSLIGQLWEIKNEIRGLFPSTEALENLPTLNGSISEKLYQIGLADSLIENGNPTDSTTAEAQKDNLLSVLESFFLLRDTLADSLFVINTADVDSLLTKNNQLKVGSFVPAINEKIVNNFWLKLLMRDSFYLDSLEIDSLVNIAISCPESGGLAVISARNILAPFNGDIFGQYNCAEEGNQRKKFTQSGEFPELNFNIFPNPNSGRFKILFNQKVNDVQSVEVDLFNLLGNRIKKFSVSGEINSLDVSLDGYPKGLYFVGIKIDGTQVGVKQIVLSY